MLLPPLWLQSVNWQSQVVPPDRELLKVGRPFARYDSWARVTIGTHAEVDRFLELLPQVLERRV